MNFLMTTMTPKEVSGAVHCPICTHTVEATIVTGTKRPYVKPGQRCPRCGAVLDAAYVLSFDRAA